MIQFSIFSLFHCASKVVLAQTFLKIGFGVGKKLKEGDGFDMEGFPEWGPSCAWFFFVLLVLVVKPNTTKICLFLGVLRKGDWV